MKRNTLHIIGNVKIHYGHRKNGQFCSRTERKRQHTRINKLIGQYLAKK